MSDLEKVSAAAAAVDFVEDGMTVGLGTGSTAAHFVRLLAKRAARGLKVRGVPTSEATRELAESVGLPLVTPDKVGRIHLAVDGADEADGAFNLIKGGGGALLREKIIASAADHFVVIVDGSKCVERLGAFPLPVEVTPFGFALTAERIYEVLRKRRCAGAEVGLREAGGPGRPMVTDGGNHILDCRCEAIPDPEGLAHDLKQITGVVEHGLFIGLARTLVVGKAKGADIRER